LGDRDLCGEEEELALGLEGEVVDVLVVPLLEDQIGEHVAVHEYEEHPQEERDLAPLALHHAVPFLLLFEAIALGLVHFELVDASLDYHGTVETGEQEL